MHAFFKTGIVAVLISGLLVQGTAVAADNPAAPGAWSAVAALKPGDYVYVQAAKKKVFAELKAVTANSISLSTKKGQTEFSLVEIRQVRYVSPRARTYQKIAFVCVMALAGIAATDLALTLRQAKDPGRGGTVGVGLLPVAGAAAGAIVFAIKGRGKKVYSAAR